MKSPKLFKLFLCLLLVTVAAACSPIKKLEVWKEETYSTHPQKMLLIAIAKRDSTRRQAENVLANQLVKRGLEAIPSYKVLPQEEKLDRQAVEKKVRELGFDSVLVARSISQKEITNHQYGGVVLGGVAVYSNGGWYGYGLRLYIQPGIRFRLFHHIDQALRCGQRKAGLVLYRTDQS